MGASQGTLGFPLTNETTTAGGVGRYNDFQRRSIYWKSSTGAKSVRGRHPQPVEGPRSGAVLSGLPEE